ncbi:MAG: ROK family protein [Pseudomonadota bacterium]
MRDGIDQIQAGLSDLQFSRICGIGIAVPGRLWQWHEQLGAPIGDSLAWKGIDFEARISAFSDLPVRIENDASAACRAELLYGHGRAFRDHAYFFLGAFVGGGMVLNNTVFQGHQNNAAAFGSLPDVTDDGQRRTLLDVASLHVLESRLRLSGRNPNELWTQPEDWSSFEPEVSHWQSEAASALARAALATCSVVDFQAIIIDGAVPRPVCTQLAEAVRHEFGQLDHRGVIPPRIEAGQVGQNARAIGAASGPLMSQFMLNSMSGPG